MKSIRFKALLAASCLVPAFVQAQTASISTTDLTPAGFNATTGMQNSTSPTYFYNDGDTVLLIKGGVIATTATIVTAATQICQAGLGCYTLPNQTVSIPSATTIAVGPFPIGRWNNALYNTVRVDFTSITTVSASALRLPQ